MKDEAKREPTRKQIARITPDPTREMRTLDPAMLSFTTDENGNLRLEISGHCCLLKAIPIQAFPFQSPEIFIEFRDENMAGYGFIERLSGLPAEQQALIRRELALRRFIPTVKKIITLDRMHGMYEWDVETDRGPASFMVRGRRENIEDMPTGEMIVTDTGGNRYRVPLPEDLDPKSRRQLERVL
ncbi:MAG TPA: DUF1854 domain-containing protein [Candidatus Brocadiia bacterium]|nr:DUF1854 domain-containing protein [Candidatus Brocadiia bacterium]